MSESEEQHKKTQAIFYISETVKDIKERVEKHDGRITALERGTEANSVKHENTHDKIAEVLRVCKETQSDVQSVKVTLAEHKLKWKMVGGVAGLFGGGITLGAKAIWEYLTSKGPTHP